MEGEPGLTKHALEAAGGDGVRALAAAVRIVRWRMVHAGELEPREEEWEPDLDLGDEEV